jgi:hypothetical protein
MHDRRGIPIPPAVMAVYVPIYFACQTEIGEATIGRYIGFWESLP